MAAMTTVLKEFSSNGNSRTSTLVGHTAVKPKVVIEKRRVPEGNQKVAEYTCKVILATVDASGMVLPNKVSLEAVCRYPLDGTAEDVPAALAVFKDIVSGDEFASSITTQGWLK